MGQCAGLGGCYWHGSGTLVGTLSVIRHDHQEGKRTGNAGMGRCSWGHPVGPVMSRQYLDAEGRPTTALLVSVTNDGRRPIEAVMISVTAPSNESLAERDLDSIPACSVKSFEMESRDGLWSPQGVNVTWRVGFRDAAGWIWTLSSDRQLYTTKPTTGLQHLRQMLRRHPTAGRSLHV